MRILFTISLLILTTVLGLWFINDVWNNDSEDVLQTGEHRAIGTSLFNLSETTQPHSIIITNKAEIPHHFALNENFIWDCTSPYQDRADEIFFLKPLINFTLGAEVVDAIPLSEVDQNEFGFEKDWIRVELADSGKKTLAKYKIGMSSTWQKRITTVDEKQQSHITDIPTIFIIKEDAPDDNILYLVADPAFGIRNVFRNDFEGFRDHRPFALNRHIMEEVSIKRDSSEIVIDRTTMKSPWRISKPLDLATDKKAITKLLVDLSNLQAIKLHNPQSISLPENSKDTLEVCIRNRDSEEKTILTIYPSEENKTTSYATINDRPGVIFELPNQPIPQKKGSLASLPKSINEIREKNMLTLDRNNIRQIRVSPALHPSINITRNNLKQKYRLNNIDGSQEQVNEISLSNLIATISVVPVKSFVTDAASDLTRYNFHNPTLQITVIPFAGRPQRLTFARKDGLIYAHSGFSSVVWEVDPEAYRLISQKYWEWKDNTLWGFQINDIKSFTIEDARVLKGAKLNVSYDYFGDEFTANFGSNDLTDKVNPIQAKFFLNNSHFIAAEKRLGPRDPAAIAALQHPTLRVSISSSGYNDEGLPTDETITKTILAAPVKSNLRTPPFYYAKVSSDDDYVIISPTTYYYLSTDIFAEE